MQAEFIPNSFQVPNAVVDRLMATLSGNALKCYLLVIRKTVGWSKTSDKISIGQFMKYCGIKKRDTAMSCLQELEKLSLVLPVKKCGQITEFFLNRIPDVPTSEPETRPDKRDDPINGTSPNKRDGGSPNERDGSSPDKRDTQTNTIQNPLIQKTNITTRTKKTNPKTLLEQHGITGQIADDFLTVRKAKRAPLTVTAMKAIEREAQNANLTLLQAITLCIERGWQSFKAEWLIQDRNPPQQRPSVKDIPKHTQGGAFLAKDLFK